MCQNLTHVGILVVRPSMTETTALGAAMAAGAAEGIGVWDLTTLKPLTTDDFTPSILPEGIVWFDIYIEVSSLTRVKTIYIWP